MHFEKEILDEFGLKVLVAGEVEFYLDPAPERSSQKESDLLAKIMLVLARNNINLYRLDRESAVGQYEFSLTPKPPEFAANEINMAKEFIIQTAIESELRAIFDAKPYHDRAGCGMHIHISLVNENGESVLKRISEKRESDEMLHVIGGLCSTMIKNFTVFAPYETSYYRFTSGKNHFDPKNPMEAYNNAPVNVSWGGNNRSTAIRIPASTIDENSRHIEHRVAGSDADPGLVIEKILEGVYFGLREKIMPPERTFGNAFDKQYSHLVPFPKSLKEAIEITAMYRN